MQSESHAAATEKVDDASIKFGKTSPKNIFPKLSRKDVPLQNSWEGESELAIMQS